MFLLEATSIYNKQWQTAMKDMLHAANYTSDKKQKKNKRNTHKLKPFNGTAEQKKEA